MADDILLDENFDLIISDGDFAIGESELQEVANILKSVEGNFKANPLIGANMEQYIRQGDNKSKIEQRVRIALKRDNKDYMSIKQKLTINKKLHE